MQFFTPSERRRSVALPLFNDPVPYVLNERISETVFRPDLKGRPVVVLSNNDGCVISRSAEAKPFVKMGEPYFKQKDLFRHHGVVCFSSNYELYADMSNRVMNTLEEMSPRSEIYSIDEIFCDLTGVPDGRRC